MSNINTYYAKWDFYVLQALQGCFLGTGALAIFLSYSISTLLASSAFTFVWGYIFVYYLSKTPFKVKIKEDELEEN